MHAGIDYRPVFERKQEASACHASQADGAAPRRGPLRWLQYLAGRKEYYMRAYPPATDGLKEKDLSRVLSDVKGMKREKLQPREDAKGATLGAKCFLYSSYNPPTFFLYIPAKIRFVIQRVNLPVSKT